MSPDTPAATVVRSKSSEDALALARRLDGPATPAVVELSTAQAAQMARTAIEARFAVAYARPRNWLAVRDRILAACQRPGFAAEALYKVPRGQNKSIEGLSVRFTEEAARHMTNLHIESVCTFDDRERRKLAVSVTDLEANLTWGPHEVVVEKFTERRDRKDREVLGERRNSENQTVYRVAATEDEVIQKQAIAVSKAARNGILRFLPTDVQEEAMQAIKATMDKPAESSAITKLVEAFAMLDPSVPLDHLLGYLNHDAPVTARDFNRLRPIYQAIVEGTTSWAEVIKDVPKESKRRTETRLSSDAAGSPEYGGGAAPSAASPATAARPARRRCEHGVPLGEPCVECDADASDGGT